MKCEKCGHETEAKNRMIKVPELKIEVEANLHTDIQRAKDIVIPEGMRLLTLSEFIYIYNNYKDKFDYGGEKPDEIVQQPIKENEKKYPYWNVWVRNLGNRSGLYGDGRSLYYDYRARGVRFCRDLKEQKK